MNNNNNTKKLIIRTLDNKVKVYNDVTIKEIKSGEELTLKYNLYNPTK